MNKHINNLLYLITGVFIGGFGFWVFQKKDSNIIQNEQITALPWQPKSIERDLPKGEEGLEIKYGFRLITETSEYIGPLAKDEKMRFAGNNLSCENCHLNGGRKVGAGSFVGVANRFPQFRGRENKNGTLEERINGCMERSMNGRVMKKSSDEMQAIIAYMTWLSDDVPPEQEELYKGYISIPIPEYKAEPIIGKKLYENNCLECHQKDGSGHKIPGDTFSGYIYPPIGGEDSYNDGAGMNRVLTAAAFIKSNMPLGATHYAPKLTDEESYHIAAYINTLERPSKPNKEADFPDITLKPVSTPYGPWADEFAAEQHKFGPFLPIIAYYKKKYDIIKKK